MDCAKYIEQFLSAHADGELTPHENREAEAHLSQCPECRAMLEDERALKAMIRDHARKATTPRAIRQRIAAAIDTAADPAPISRAAAAPSITRSAPSFSMRRARVWAPIAIAAMLIIGLVARRGWFAPAPEVEAFDSAIEQFDAFENHFEPNVPSASAAEISAAYVSHRMPGFIWNFGGVGYPLVGGRIDRMPDGRPATFTFYRGADGAIMCRYMDAAGLKQPPGAVHEADGHAFYEYKGYAICLSRLPGNFVCVLISRKPVGEFMRTIRAALS